MQDIGFYAIDNLPIQVFKQTLNLISDPSASTFKSRGLAFGMDIRDSLFAKEFPKLKKELEEKFTVDVLFLEAEAQTIATRYSSTRRKHPLLGLSSKDSGSSISTDLIKAIELEKIVLRPIWEVADAVFDTTGWSPHFLSRVIERRYEGSEQFKRNLTFSITSFGFKNGLPRPLDSLVDVRFIDNPYFTASLKEKTGLDPAVKKFVLEDKKSQVFLDKLEDLLRFVLPLCFEEGKYYMRLGIGCTGGKHRSVAVSEELLRRLKENPLLNIEVEILHRDLNS